MKKIRKHRVTASRPMRGRRYVKADENYPENYAEMGYESLDDAIEAYDMLKGAYRELKGYIEDIDYRMKMLDTTEWFSGPAEAAEFAGKTKAIAEKMQKLVDDFYYNAVDTSNF